MYVVPKTVIFCSSDGDTVAVDLPLLVESSFHLRDLLKLHGNSETPLIVNIPWSLKSTIELLFRFLRISKDDDISILPVDLSLEKNISECTLSFLEEIKDLNMLPSISNLVFFLQIPKLHKILSAYIARCLHKISEEEPDIMTGAEKIRSFLNIPNRWTPEEIPYLEKEMKLAAYFTDGKC